MGQPLHLNGQSVIVLRLTHPTRVLRNMS